MAREAGSAAELRKKEKFLTKVYNEMVAALDDDTDITFDIFQESIDIADWKGARSGKVRTGVVTWTITFTPKGL